MPSRSSLTLLCLAALSLLITACTVPVGPGQAGDDGMEVQEPAQTSITTAPGEIGDALNADTQATPNISTSEATLDRTHGAPPAVGISVEPAGPALGTESSSGPVIASPDESGILQGHVSVSGQPAGGNKAGWKVAIFDADGQTEIAVLDLDATGMFRAFLPDGLYTVRLRNSASEQIIGQVQVNRGETTTLDMNIDANP